MKLGEIRNYVKKHKQAYAADVANHFDISQDAARFALDYWVKKGKVQTLGASCGSSCSGCGSAGEAYQWVNNETPIQWYKLV